MPKGNPIFTEEKKEDKYRDHLNEIKSLEDALNRLNILEHPREIREICNSIIDIKRILADGSLKT